jgi:hypothetical protein
VRLPIERLSFDCQFLTIASLRSISFTDQLNGIIKKLSCDFISFKSSKERVMDQD